MELSKDTCSNSIIILPVLQKIRKMNKGNFLLKTSGNASDLLKRDHRLNHKQKGRTTENKEKVRSKIRLKVKKTLEPLNAKECLNPMFDALKTAPAKSKATTLPINNLWRRRNASHVRYRCKHCMKQTAGFLGLKSHNKQMHPKLFVNYKVLDQPVRRRTRNPRAKICKKKKRELKTEAASSPTFYDNPEIPTSLPTHQPFILQVQCEANDSLSSTERANVIAQHHSGSDLGVLACAEPETNVDEDLENLETIIQREMNPQANSQKVIDFSCTDGTQRDGTIAIEEVHQLKHSFTQALAIDGTNLAPYQTNETDIHPSQSLVENPFSQIKEASGATSTSLLSTVYRCFCGNGSDSLIEFLKHQWTHLSEKSFTCPICGVEFFSVKDFILHAEAHPDVENVTLTVCKICDCPFSKQDELNLHYVQKHGCLILCDACHQVCNNSEEFNRHRGSHSTCSTCGKIFSSDLALKVHMATVHI